MQFGGQYELIHRTLFKIAYHFQNVQVDVSTINDYSPNLEEAILFVPHLIYLGTSYSSRKGIGFELNGTYNSSQGYLPLAMKNAVSFTMLNLQISKGINGQFYIGIQNLLNVRQLNPIVGGDLPFDGVFDASIVWPNHGKTALRRMAL